jgi:hypothetical protein
LWLQGQFNQLNNMVDDAIMLTGAITIPSKREAEEAKNVEGEA